LLDPAFAADQLARPSINARVCPHPVRVRRRVRFLRLLSCRHRARLGHRDDANFSAPLPKRPVLSATRRECGCEIYREPGDMYTSMNSSTRRRAFTTSALAIPRADPRVYRSSCSQSAHRKLERVMKFSVAGIRTSLCAALAMVPTYRFVTCHLCGTLDCLCKLPVSSIWNSITN
jgi:hypothetical protein